MKHIGEADGRAHFGCPEPGEERFAAPDLGGQFLHEAPALNGGQPRPGRVLERGPGRVDGQVDILVIRQWRFGENGLGIGRDQIDKSAGCAGQPAPANEEAAADVLGELGVYV